MNEAKFEKVSQSDKPLYGPRKLLLCGFSQSVQPNFNEAPRRKRTGYLVPV